MSHHDHDHHDHDHHDHDHRGHHHAPASFGRAFALGVALNLGFVVLEAFYGWLAHSVALIADAGHNLGDVLGLGVAWLASELAKRAPSPRYSYGLGHATILAALFNAVFLLVAVGAISWEAVQRFGAPEPVATGTVTVVAALGILINGVTAWLFAGGRDDLNVRGAFLHMAADAAVSAGVVIAGLVIAATGWLWLDPLTSLAINAVIVVGTWRLLSESLGMSMAAAPAGVDPAAVRAFLAAQPQVASLHDLHIWPISTADIALTCHLVTPAGHPGDPFLHEVCAELGRRFRIRHATIQIEIEEGRCALAPDEVV